MRSLLLTRTVAETHHHIIYKYSQLNVELLIQLTTTFSRPNLRKFLPRSPRALGLEWRKKVRRVQAAGAGATRMGKGKVLPPDAKIAKDAKQTYLECVSVFISFITSEASDKCRKDKRQTLNGDDLIWAMNRLGFQDYVNPLNAYLKKYRQVTQIEVSKVFNTHQLIII
ncbi:unnamed protein product [Lactuca virosa]|uniref:Transcription factor CBF/NF-Y/archaeal histone domain-containing protein n=1 Tax=Lactuca virosa TaxID=75947 RepID=A0AAU9PQM4_9ASTR|nr:unnamed protein product [Lactuca virosa]